MNFDKVKLITTREYWTRVRKKTFLISTILTPLAIIGITVLSGFLSSGAITKTKNILVKDDSGILAEHLTSNRTYSFNYTSQPLESAKESLQSGDFDMLLHINTPKGDVLEDIEIQLISNEKPGLSTTELLERKLKSAYKKYNTIAAGYKVDELERLDPSIDINIDLLKEGADEEEVSNASIAIGSALGGAMGFLMYIILLVYGSFVMRSVMEEKINRIVEVVISSVKPFELMLGKILGVGLVGLTQIAVWIILIGIGLTITTAVFGVGQVDPAVMADAMDELQTASASTGSKISKILEDILALNWPMIVIVLIIFFFGGFFIYSSLFAAVGSAIGDDMTEGQSLTFPIMVPIIASILLLFPTLEDPHGALGVFGSLFPLTSPILMPARIAFEPPIWQVLISIVLLLASCLFFVWLSGKIYRAGILLYGKKLSVKNLWQIIRN